MKKILFIVTSILLVLSAFLWQKNVYDNRIGFFQGNIEALKVTVSQLNVIIEDREERLLQLAEDNNALAVRSGELEDELLAMKYDALKGNLPEYWNSLWESVHSTKGELTDKQIEEINFLLQPTFNNWSQVNPLSCYFTSYYKDVTNINLADFLRYFPNGETPEVLQELEALRQKENWPFQDITLENIPVPIHRYKRELVQDVFEAYAGISLNDLSGVGFNDVLYLESTDAYYNFTSDFGPGIFICTDGFVDDGRIRLHGKSSRDSDIVLTIIKFKDKYYIESYYKE